MNYTAEILLKKMGEDKSFAEKILTQTDKEKVIEIARGEEIELTMEDIDEINEAISKVLQQKKEGEITEEELENVAGGNALGGNPIPTLFITQLGRQLPWTDTTEITPFLIRFDESGKFVS